MSRKIDADGVRNIGATAVAAGVPERWLRDRVAAGDVPCIRIGWNLFVANSEIENIQKLAKQCGK
jgi:hypothetical protein